MKGKFVHSQKIFLKIKIYKCYLKNEFSQTLLDIYCVLNSFFFFSLNNVKSRSPLQRGRERQCCA